MYLELAKVATVTARKITQATLINLECVIASSNEVRYAKTLSQQHPIKNFA
jgi:hypothetical protein